MEEIGRRLRAAREARGLSMELVEEETHIRRKYIEALEGGRYSDLPGDAYLKGFLRTYGNYLGLDGTNLVEQYKQSSGGDEGQGAAAADRHGARSGAQRRSAPPASPGAGTTAAERQTASAAERQPADDGTERQPTRSAPVQPPISGGAQPSGSADRPLGRLADRPADRPASTSAERPSAVPAQRYTRRQAEAGPVAPTQSTPTPASVARRQSNTTRPARDRRPANSKSSLVLRRLAALLVMVAVIVGVGYLGWKMLSAMETPQNTTPPPQTPVDSVKQPDPPPPAPKLPDPPKVTMARGTGEDVLFAVPGQEITLKIEPTAEVVWIEAKVDGIEKPVFSAKTKQTQEFKGGQMRVRMGHMNGVNLVVNGQRFDNILKDGPYTLILNKQ